jgi:hypothetical protein
VSQELSGKACWKKSRLVLEGEFDSLPGKWGEGGMNIVICTGVGVVLVAAFVGLIFALMSFLLMFSEYLSRRGWRATKVIAKTLWLIFLSAMGVAVLFFSHEVGCKVIHLSMGHK